MRGLRIEPDKKFEKFFSEVQSESEKKKSVFFLNCGEGNDLETETLYAENLSGWLIPSEYADDFEKIWEHDRDFETLAKWEDFFIWVFYEIKNASLKITFKNF